MCPTYFYTTILQRSTCIYILRADIFCRHSRQSETLSAEIKRGHTKDP